MRPRKTSHQFRPRRPEIADATESGDMAAILTKELPRISMDEQSDLRAMITFHADADQLSAERESGWFLPGEKSSKLMLARRFVTGFRQWPGWWMCQQKLWY
jgi:hypothetical protein